MKKGFTLIELLVVVLIIGILSAVALSQYQMAVFKSRVIAGLPLARALKEAQDRYYLANGEFARDPADLDISVPADCKVVFMNGSEHTRMNCPYASYIFRADMGGTVAQVLFVPAKQPSGVYQVRFVFPYEASRAQSCYQPYKEPSCYALGGANYKDAQVCKIFSSRPGEFKTSTCAGGKYFPL